ncbi:hypothetical protein ALTER154_40652 [Alteromonas sp. 154]|nr:hypothetical protein ALTER154_40652 [Alteromonas sp. 154]
MHVKRSQSGARSGAGSNEIVGDYTSYSSEIMPNTHVYR